ncbi:MAG: hypothetical protein ACRD0K_05145 [Egibacteraceae bacterium]
MRALGEAKASDRPRTVADLERLGHVRGLLTARGVDAGGARLPLFGRRGFDRRLRDAGGARLLLFGRRGFDRRLRDAGGARLLLFGRRGFDRRLRDAARQRPDVALVDVDRLYRGG